jgi:hypothetical protein
MNEEGKRLGVCRHRLVFLNPKNVGPRTPAGARRWMELIADSFDGVVDEAEYQEALLARVIGAIKDKTISPDELARIKDEAAWARALSEERREGEREGKRRTLLMLAQTAGIALGPADLARVEACADPEVLDTWIARVLGAMTAGEIFG